jgi:hypothetical protein
METMLYCTPEVTEYHEYYAAYVARAAGADVIQLLAAQMLDTGRFLRRFRDAEAERSPALGEWTMKEVISHLCDFERVFSYRILCISRGEDAALPSFEQDAYVAVSGANARSLASLADELASLRRSTVLQLHGLPLDAWQRTGVASGWSISVRALATVIAGHEQGHLADLRRDYLS